MSELRARLVDIDDRAAAVVLASLWGEGLRVVTALREGRRGGPRSSARDVEETLRRHGVDAPAGAAELARAGATPADVEALADQLDSDALARLVAWLGARLGADALLDRLDAALEDLSGPPAGDRDVTSP